MYILGDIGNSDTKLCLVSTRNKIVKKIDAGEIFERAKFKINDKITAYEIDLRSIFFGKICFRKRIMEHSCI